MNFKIKSSDFINKSLFNIFLPALTILFGLQTLRILIPTITYVYGDSMGASTIQRGIYAAIVFLISFLFAIISRIIGIKLILVITTFGVGLIRLLEQIFSSSYIDFYLSTIGTVIFILFIPSYLSYIWSTEYKITGNNKKTWEYEYIIGILFGFALDTGILGAFRTYDINWHYDIFSFFVILLLTLIQFYLLFSWIKSTGLIKREKKLSRKEPNFLFSIPMIGFGSFLFLQLLFFQNIGYETFITSLSQPIVFSLITLGNIIAIMFSIFILKNLNQRWIPIVVSIEAILLILFLILIKRGGWISAILFILCQIILASALTIILIGLQFKVKSKGLWRSTISYGVGVMLLVAMIFGYYAVYDIKIPINNQILPPISAGILIVCIAISLFKLNKNKIINLSRNYLMRISVIGIIGILILSVVINIIGWKKTKYLSGNGYPVRVMSYNLHQGFDTKGYLGIKAIAKVIEESNADIIALQEVSRGWYINGSLDMLTWLSQKLNMPYIYGPVGDPLFGNAILSKYPVLEYKNKLLPKGDVPLQRGFLWAKFDLGNNEELFMIATHLHHIEEDNHVRIPQIKSIVDYWGNHDKTVILGDMNAKPHWPETQIYYNSGLLDTFIEAGIGNGYTYSSDKPEKRIDYIWISPDLTASDFLIPKSTASDHLGVVVTIDKR
jgi:endonuclease/exonuclease/phosphatase family metal-dependent hydrolase